ncbi:hypothetical protein ABC345_04715 [Shouchella sp. 1P09AA]|uniref:hypothetical protein n=1 Tax=unclassified Shouchella TaxID=2893065 RepID=UPI0039A08089
MNAVIQEIAKRYQFDYRQFVCVGGFYNQVFSNGVQIIKYFHESQVDIAQMEHEVDVMTYMNKRGILSANVIYSKQQRMIEEIDCQGSLKKKTSCL